MKSATQTYEGFISLVKWGTIACALVAALVVVLIAS
ncbi:MULTISPECIES: aa3-type cytochrome c oxidase subunit IV [Sphingobium]|nr:aa3-type cytochrome c oxidase subunit IV [Sphingobium sp. 15-1]